MSNYYDPWAHAVRLFVNRLVLFVVLSGALGLATWAALLHVAYTADAKAVVRFTWSLLTAESDLAWRVILAQSLTIGTLVTAWLFTWLLGRARLRRGERHHRGARVIDAQE